MSAEASGASRRRTGEVRRIGRARSLPGARGRHDARPPYHQQPAGRADRIRPPQGHRRAAAAARRLLQARAPRAHDDRRAQRRGQDDAAADARGRGVDRPRRAERAKGVRIALHDQRPPRERAHRAARLRAVRLRARSSRSRRELAELERTMAAGAATRRRARPLRPRAGAPGGARRLPVARPRDGDGARAGLRRGGPRPRAGHLLRRAADARLARPRARRRAPTCCCSTSPPTTSTSSRWSGSSRRSSGLDAAVVLVAHDRWFLEAVGTAVLELEAGRSRFFAGTWHAWRREQAAREIALGKAIDTPAGGDRAHGALHRALPLQGDEGQPGAVAREEAREDRAASSAIRATGRGLEFAFARAGALGAGGLRAERRRAWRSGSSAPIVLLEHAELWLERGEHVSLVGPNGTARRR